MNSNELKKPGDRVGYTCTLTQEFRDVLEELINRESRTCLNCAHWISERSPVAPGTCRLAGIRPPPSIIVNGCEKHEDEIPF